MSFTPTPCPRSLLPVPIVSLLREVPESGCKSLGVSPDVPRPRVGVRTVHLPGPYLRGPTLVVTYPTHPSLMNPRLLGPHLLYRGDILRCSPRVFPSPDVSWPSLSFWGDLVHGPTVSVS